jgi:RNA polymerase sigma-70 factor (ECF subfamily)
VSLLPAAVLPESFAPFRQVRDAFGSVPAIFRAQGELTRLIEAEARICGAVLATAGALTRDQKEGILLAVASRRCRSDDSPADQALFDAARRLGALGGGINRSDIDGLRALGFSDAHVLEAILTTALTRFLCTASCGLDVEQDFVSSPVSTSPARHDEPADVDPAWAVAGPYLDAVERDADTFAPFAFFREAFGFVPNVFRAQTLRPDVLEAEAYGVETLLLTTDVLSRVQKESILLTISAANSNTYCVAIHSEILRALGMDEDACELIAVDHHQSRLPVADQVLLDFTLRVARGTRSDRQDMDRLHAVGFSDRQILEAVAVSALANFLNTVQSGLGTVPDFTPRRYFAAQLKQSRVVEHPEDPDTELVDRARKGDVGGFEELVRRHHRRVLRAALGVTGQYEDAEDVAQIAFVKAFQNLGTFERHARFSTWLTRIAINEALSRVRARKPTEALPLDGEDRSDFKPAIIGAWVDSPEQVYAREELRSLVERALADIPVKYRLPVLLRDVEQLSTLEAASALGLAVPTLKKHLLRGRLMLREALAPHFLSGQGAVARV